MKKIGIYKITNLKTNQVYVGSSVNLDKRYSYHLRDLKYNRHYNIHLQRSFNIYGENSFEYSIIEECEEKLLIEKEEYYIHTLSILNNGYNISPYGNRPPSWSGKKHKPSTLLKISKANKGKIISQHTKNIASLTHKGKKLSQKNIDELRKRNLGEQNPMFGKKYYNIWVEKYGVEQADIRLKIMNEKKREKMLHRTITEETRKKLSGENHYMFGKNPYVLWCEKYGKEEAEIRYEKWKNVNLGRKASEETKLLFSKQRKGDLNPSCKIKDIEIPKILEMIKNNISIKDIAKIYNVSNVTIHNIKKGKRKPSL